ncbi:MAG: hypothetical protein U1G08_02430 [Verrucomicrobiota bacterium]
MDSIAIGSVYRNNNLTEGGPTTEPQKPNRFVVTAVSEAGVSLLQDGCAESTLFSWGNFTRDFDLVEAKA